MMMYPERLARGDCFSTGQEPAAPPRTLRLLVVDDEPAICQILTILLAEGGHEVQTARDGVDALQKFDAGHWDAVITDRAMPGMGGEELAARVKRKVPGTQVILLTGLAEAVDPKGVCTHTIDQVLKKPFTAATLKTAVARIVAQKAGVT